MEKHQGLIVVAIILIFTLTLGLTAYLTQGRGPASSISTVKRFTAKPGTTREKAMVLSTDKRSKPTQTFTPPEAVQEDEEPKTLTIRSLSPEKEGEEGPSVADEIIGTAVNALSPEEGLQTIEDELAIPHAPKDQARLYLTQATLMAQMLPPKTEEALAALDKAMSLAPGLAQQQRIAKHKARLLFANGEFVQARQLLETTLQSAQEITMPGLELSLLLGKIYEKEATYDEAERLYRRTMRLALGLKRKAVPEAESLMRLTALRLAQLYKTTGHPEKAEILAQELPNQLTDDTE